MSKKQKNKLNNKVVKTEPVAESTTFAEPDALEKSLNVTAENVSVNTKETEPEKKVQGQVVKQKNNKKKEKKPSKIAKRVRETNSELKKVTWPSFSTVVKKTGVVLAVVVIFTVILFGIDRLLSLLFNFVTSSLKG